MYRPVGMATESRQMESYCFLLMFGETEALQQHYDLYMMVFCMSENFQRIATTI
jgi:hypothetical protein